MSKTKKTGPKTLKDTLAILNKNVSENDMFKIASEMPKEAFDVVLSSTGSPYLDYRIGGIGMGRLTLYTGWEGSGKSSFALLAAAAMQRDMNKMIVYFDSENAVTNSHLDRFNVDRDLLIHRPTQNLEEMLNQANLFSQTETIGMIIIDSVKAFYATSEEEKDANEHTIGLAAKRWNTKIPIILSHCRRNGTALLIINQWRVNPGATMNTDNRVLPGGLWQSYMASLWINFSNKTEKRLIFDGDKNVIGHIVDVSVYKSRYHAYAKADKTTLNFYYTGGFDKFDEYANLLSEMGVIEIKGSWYHFPNGHKEQGQYHASAYLAENPEYLDKLLAEHNLSAGALRTTVERKEDNSDGTE